jgi:hypothetical protein
MLWRRRLLLLLLLLVCQLCKIDPWFAVMSLDVFLCLFVSVGGCVASSAVPCAADSAQHPCDKPV